MEALEIIIELTDSSYMLVNAHLVIEENHVLMKFIGMRRRLMDTKTLEKQKVFLIYCYTETHMHTHTQILILLEPTKYTKVL